MAPILNPKPKAATVLPTPTPATPAPVTPTIDTAQQAQVDSDRMRRRTGRAATMLTGAAGDTGGATAKKILLGS